MDFERIVGFLCSCFTHGGRRSLARSSLILAVGLFGSADVRAHFTEPPHALWMVSFPTDTEKVAPTEPVQLTAFSRFTPPHPLPPPGRVFFTRTYDMAFPDGFNVTYASLSFSPNDACTIQSNTVRCQASSALEAGDGDALTVVAVASPLEGAYQATLTTTAIVDGSAYPDSDTVTITLVARRDADLAWTLGPAGAEVLEIGEPQTFTYVLTNHGPEEAREVRADFFADSPEENQFVSSSPADPECRTSAGGVSCAFGSLAAGASKTITLTMHLTPLPQVVAGEFTLYALVQSYEHDPDVGNNDIMALLLTHCALYIDPSARVAPSAKLAEKDCTFVGPNTVIEAHATLKKGAYVVADAVVGKAATIGVRSVLEGGRAGTPGSIAAHGKIGTDSAFMGEIGAHGTVGDHVQAGGETAFWVIVERHATIGSRSSIRLLRPWEQRVKIFEHAKVPDATVIDEAYCQQHANICTID